MTKEFIEMRNSLLEIGKLKQYQFQVMNDFLNLLIPRDIHRDNIYVVKKIIQKCEHILELVGEK